jgi:hypothetical protein
MQKSIYISYAFKKFRKKVLLAKNPFFSEKKSLVGASN